MGEGVGICGVSRFESMAGEDDPVEAWQHCCNGDRWSPVVLTDRPATAVALVLIHLHLDLTVVLDGARLTIPVTVAVSGARRPTAVMRIGTGLLVSML